MKTMKKFWKYFLNFIVLFLLVTGLTWLGTINFKNSNRKLECVAQADTSDIQIIECTDKKITGMITNNTNVLINKTYIKADFYDKNSNLLGTKYFEITYFNVGEKIKFEIDFSYKNVANIKLTNTETKI